MPVHARAEQIAEHLIRDEGARPNLAVIIADMLADRLRWPNGGGAPAVLTKDGQPDPTATVADLIGEMRASFPECFAGGPTSAPSTGSPRYAPGTATARALAERAAQKADPDTVNPFLPATRNLTRAALLERDNPERAAKLKAAAGIKP